MVWNVQVGTSAPGLGKVLDTQQPNPSYNDDQLFSGHNGQVCLIFVGTENGNLTPFCIALWVYGEDEPRKPERFYLSVDLAVEAWTKIRNQMEGIE